MVDRKDFWIVVRQRHDARSCFFPFTSKSQADEFRAMLEKCFVHDIYSHGIEADVEGDGSRVQPIEGVSLASGVS